MFQEHVGTGLLFLIGIAVGTPPAVWLAALLGLVVSTLTTPASQREQGLGGFNGILVGAALGTFLDPQPLLWLFAAVVTPPVMRAVSKLCATVGLSALTAPFVLVSWTLLLAAQPFTTLGPAEATAPAQLGWGFWPTAILQGISQVFLVQNPLSGALLLAGLAISSRWAAGLALLGSTLGAALALLAGAPATAVEAGLYGFSPVLTAIALGCTFCSPNARNLAYAALATAFTVFLQGALNTALQPVSLPALTAPFVIATWLFQLGHPFAGDEPTTSSHL